MQEFVVHNLFRVGHVHREAVHVPDLAGVVDFNVLHCFVKSVGYVNHHFRPDFFVQANWQANLDAFLNLVECCAELIKYIFIVLLAKQRTNKVTRLIYLRR